MEEICGRFEAAGTAARPHVYVGTPAEGVEKAARECLATMVALGSSSKNRWVERWIGSAPQEIAERSAEFHLAEKLLGYAVGLNGVEAPGETLQAIRQNRSLLEP